MRRAEGIWGEALANDEEVRHCFDLPGLGLDLPGPLARPRKSSLLYGRDA